MKITSSFWNVPYRGNLSWCWRKLLQVRPLLRNFIWVKIGNGQTVSAWHDIWCNDGPLYDRITPRDIHRAGFTIDSKVCDLVINGVWNWPSDWNSRFPSLPVLPLLSSSADEWLWKDRNGELKDFSVNSVWEELRPRKDKVVWHDLVWFSYGIPRHAFVLWLVFKGRLKTQDLMLQWDKSLDLRCPFCSSQPDSHCHLFFECSFCRQVWNRVNQKAGSSPKPCRWDLIVDILIPRAKKRSVHNVADKLCLAATVYFIWQERNARLFKNESRSVDVLVDVIMSTVRLKMLTFRYKRNLNVERFLAAWDLPVLLVNH